MQSVQYNVLKLGFESSDSEWMKYIYLRELVKLPNFGWVTITFTTLVAQRICLGFDDLKFYLIIHHLIFNMSFFIFHNNYLVHFQYRVFEIGQTRYILNFWPKTYFCLWPNTNFVWPNYPFFTFGFGQTWDNLAKHK